MFLKSLSQKASKAVSVSFLTLALTSFAQAELAKAPPALSVDRTSNKAVFTDFLSAQYKVTYDVRKSSAYAESAIEFATEQEGMPIFDLVPTPLNVALDGKTVDSMFYNIQNVTAFRYLTTVVPAGRHHLVIKNNISENVTFNGTGVRSAFWTSDLDDRTFLEQYLPANLEFDTYASTIDVVVTGTEQEHEIFTNGEIQVLGKNQFRIQTPNHFNASSLFFHIVPKSTFRQTSFNYRSIDGRDIPVLIYTGSVDLAAFKTKTAQTLAELERDYGPFPHPKVVIYGAGSGGMEYHGATITSLWALAHELTHSYFARGIMPANGNSGWIDEAIASWRDDGYRQNQISELSPSTMAGKSVYMRMTDDNAYTKGSRFMGYMDKLLSAKGGLKKFLKGFFEEFHFNPFTTELFKQQLEQFYGQSLDVEFNKYIYGRGQKIKELSEEHHDNAYHPRLTKEQLRQLL